MASTASSAPPVVVIESSQSWRALDPVRSRSLAILGIAGLGAPLLAYAITGAFSRYAADDYCTAGRVQSLGVAGAQMALYTEWSGRFAATLLITLAEAIGPVLVPLLPALMLVAWVAALFWAARGVFSAGGLEPRRLPAALLAGLVVFATLDTTADMPQTLYWQTGALTYLSPLVLATAYAGWVARTASGPSSPRRGLAALAVSFGLTLFAGGTSETFAAAQVAALGLAAGTAWLAGARSTSRLQALLLAGVLGAVLALVIVALSPGNEVRQQTTSRTAMSVAVPESLRFSAAWLRLTFARPHAIVLLLLFGLPAAIGAGLGDRRVGLGRRRLVVIAGGLQRRGLVVMAGAMSTALVMLASMLPAFYALGTNPPGRAQVVPQYVLVCGIASLGVIFGLSARPALARVQQRPALRWASAGALIVLLGAGPVFRMGQVLERVGPDRAYAAAWDDVDHELRAAQARGSPRVSMRPLEPTGNVPNLAFVGPDPDDWFNQCVARYYRLISIAVAEDGTR